MKDGIKRHLNAIKTVVKNSERVENENNRINKMQCKR